MELIGSMLDPILTLIWSITENSIGLGIFLAILIGVPYIIFSDIKKITKNKKNFKDFILSKLPIAILAILIGVGLGYCSI